MYFGENSLILLTGVGDDVARTFSLRTNRKRRSVRTGRGVSFPLLLRYINHEHFYILDEFTSPVFAINSTFSTPIFFILVYSSHLTFPELKFGSEVFCRTSVCHTESLLCKYDNLTFPYVPPSIGKLSKE